MGQSMFNNSTTNIIPIDDVPAPQIKNVSIPAQIA